MGRALFTGVSGLQAHQGKLDVIANNIANVNTTGFRSSRALFQDLISQTLQGASPSATTSGGTNAVQIGLGTTLASVDINFSQGSLQTTGYDSDMAIEGRGFFVLSNDGTAGGYYTRDGSFSLNENGQLIDPATGLYVMGYGTDATTGEVDVNAGLQVIEIPLGGASTVRATSLATLVGNLNSEAAVGATVERTIRVYDSLGTVRDIDLTFTKDAATNEWTWAAATTDADVDTITGSGTLTFDTDGTLLAPTTDTVQLTFLAGASSAPVDPMSFTIDFGLMTQLADLSDATIQNQDGLSAGTLESYTVGSDGTITGIFSNGLTEVLGQMALANFSNESGLLRAGQNLFIESSNSGDAQVGVAGTGGLGDIAGQTLEASNVDLGTEFSNLILTQRGYQANARTITTADTLLQETVNLIR